MSQEVNHQDENPLQVGSKRNRAKISQSKNEMILKEQAIMFGPMISTLFDCIHETVETVIKEGVSTLPFLPSSDPSSSQIKGKELLMKILRESYTKNIDVAELYAVRNIFAIPHSFTKKQRNQILSSYEKEMYNVEKNGLDVLSDRLHNRQSAKSRNEETKIENDSWKSRKINLPKSAAEIPSKEQMEHLDTETLKLQSEFILAKEKKKRLIEHIGAIDKSLGSATEAEKRLNDIIFFSEKDSTEKSFEKIQESVSAAIMGQEALRNICAQGTSLIENMDTVKNVRQEQKGTNNNFDGEETKELSAAMKRMSQSIQESERAKKNKPLNLDKDLEERRKKAKIVLKESKVGAFTKFLKR